MGRTMTFLRRAVGWSLVALATLPFYRLLEASDGLAARQFLAGASAYTRSIILASAIVAVVAFTLSGWVTRLWTPLCRGADVLRGARIALLAGVSALAVSSAFSLIVLDGGPYLVDGMVQLVQARLFSAGELVLPADWPVEHWHFQYMAPASQGWASQYPPGYSAVLGVGLFIGLPWLVGPIIHGLTAWLGVRLAERLFPDDGGVVLVAAGFLTLSPFTTVLAGSYMNHGLAALLGLVAVWAGLRAAEGNAFAWGLAAGAGVGLLATVRPLTAVLFVLIAGTAWFIFRDRERSRGGRWRFPVAAAVAAAPPTLMLLWYNRTLFGGPFTFGYSAAQGPGHGLGFHVDPWGATYGLRQALAYTATELQALGPEMAGLAVPLVAIVGLALVFTSDVGRRQTVLVVWALAPVVAGFFYWHHDLSMGPRLFADAAPAWALLSAWSLVRGARWLLGARRGAYARFGQSLALVTLAAAMVAAPLRLNEYRVAAVARGLIVDPAPDGSLVFVHDTWESRVSARLAAGGLRDDQIRRASASYSLCELQTVLDSSDGSSAGFLDHLTEPRRQPVPLATRIMPSGSPVRTFTGEQLTPECEAQAASDFRGIAGLPQRLWRGDLPGAERGRALYLRDMGPVRNEQVRNRFAEREALFLLLDNPESTPRLVTYNEGVARLWSAGGRMP